MVSGAPLGPTGRYSTMEPSGNTFRGLFLRSEVGLAVKKGVKLGENSISFFGLKMSNVFRVD